MEAKFGGKPHHFYDQLASDVKAVEKKNAEWNLNDWKWDGALFEATPLNSVSSDCRSRQLFPAGPETPVNAGSPHSSPSCSVQNNPENEKGKRELEKRRKIVVFDCEEANAGSASLNLKLGEQIYPIMDDDAKCGKKTKVTGTASSRAVCQVEDCRADLSNAKDYHRRHKVCEMHSKANKVLVGNLMQRFCQQCSRFHALQEFDEGKRSCRRRLAGHNRRRRKTHPDNVATVVAANHSDKTKDQDLLSHLLRSLASLPGSTNGSNMSGLLQGSEGAVNAARSSGNLEKLTDMVSDGTKNAKHSGSASKLNEYANIRDSQGSIGHCGILPASDLVQRRSAALQDGNLSGSPSKMPITAGGNLPFITNEPEATAAGRTGMNNIDLNDVYDGSQDNVENLELYPVRKNPVNESLQSIGHILASNKLSPQHLSGNSDSTSSQSLSTSSGEAQSRTDRIVFKLFGKDPNDCPIALRRQILDWLSHSPTDIESYIKPGCIVLTIYLRLTESAWEELCCDLGSSLRRLVDASNDSFWKTGWVYARVQHSVAFIYDGQVVLDSPLPLKSHKSCWISSITPIAVSLKEQAQFVVKGFNLNRFGTRLLCAIQGKYLVQAAGYNVMVINPVNEHDELQYLCFPCSIPDIPGRGFIEVEDHGLSSTFFPFIVAEQDVCSEICTLEGVIETAVPTIDINENAEKMETKIQAIDFIHEMGWLLHRNHLNWKLGDLNPNLNLFPFRRFKWLMNFSVDHDWCAVVKKLLSILFDGTVDLGDHSSIEYALLDMCLLHRAVQRNCRPMVELLLRFVPDKVSDKPGSEQKPQGDQDYHGFMFKPNVAGPAGLTPLHVAAGREGSENVLDVLTNDPGSVAIEACRADT